MARGKPITTKIYTSITGNIFLQKKKEIQKTLIIPKLENLGLARSLSFVPSPVVQNNLTVAKTPVSNSNEIVKENKNISQKPNLHTDASPTQKQDNQITEKFSNNNTIATEKNETVIAKPIAKASNIISPTNISTKKEANQNVEQPKENKNIVSEVLKKKDSTINKPIIKDNPSVMASMPTQKKESINIESTKPVSNPIAKSDQLIKQFLEILKKKITRKIKMQQKVL